MVKLIEMVQNELGVEFKGEIILYIKHTVSKFNILFNFYVYINMNK